MLVEYWRWRYRDPVTGQICRTTTQMTAGEASVYPEAQRIPGTLAFREIDDPDYSSSNDEAEANRD